MTRRTILTLAALAGVALLAIALLRLDFHASRGDTRANASTSSFSMGEPRGAARGAGGQLSLAIPGEDPFAQALRSELPATLRAEGVFRGVEVVESVLSVASGPALLVEVPHRDILWTPLHARGKLTVRVAYASNGDLSWRDEATVHMDNRDGPVLWARGEFQIEDATSGVVSQPHYYGHLGSRVAAEVARSLRGSVNDPG